MLSDSEDSIETVLKKKSLKFQDNNSTESIAISNQIEWSMYKSLEPTLLAMSLFSFNNSKKLHTSADN